MLRTLCRYKAHAAPRQIYDLGHGTLWLPSAGVSYLIERVVIQLFSHVNVRGPSNSPHMDQHRSWDSGHSAILNLSVKVLDFVKSGGPECTVLRTFRWEVLI